MDRKPPNSWLTLLGWILPGVGIWMGVYGGLRGSIPLSSERTPAQAPLAGAFAPGVPEPAIAAFGEQLGLSFPLLLDPGAEVQELYRVRGYPTSGLVDRSGTIQIHHIGVMSEEQLQGYLKQLVLVAT